MKVNRGGKKNKKIYKLYVHMYIHLINLFLFSVVAGVLAGINRDGNCKKWKNKSLKL
jgi:hypothetical protein